MCIYHILTAIQRISTDRNPAINITKVGWSADEILEKCYEIVSVDHLKKISVPLM